MHKRLGFDMASVQDAEDDQEKTDLAEKRKPIFHSVNEKLEFNSVNVEVGYLQHLSQLKYVFEMLQNDYYPLDDALPSLRDFMDYILYLNAKDKRTPNFEQMSVPDKIAYIKAPFAQKIIAALRDIKNIFAEEIKNGRSNSGEDYSVKIATARNILVNLLKEINDANEIAKSQLTITPEKDKSEVDAKSKIRNRVRRRVKKTFE